MGLSVVARGTLKERIRLAFAMVDADKSGALSKGEVIKMLLRLADAGEALSCLNTKSSERAEQEQRLSDITAFVDRVFDRFDVNKDGELQIDEFERAVRESEAFGELEKKLTLRAK